MGEKKLNKNILIATGLYPPDIGGPATYVRMLEEELPTKNIGCTIVPFTHIRHLPKVIRHVVYTWKLIKQVRSADAIYALDPVSVGAPAFLVSMIFRKPFLIRLGGDYAWEQGQQRFGLEMLLDEYTVDKNSAPWQVRTLAMVQSFVVRRAAKVIVPSTYMKGVVETWGVKTERITVIYSALFPLEVTQSHEELRKEFGYTGPVLLTSARLTPWKGIDTVLEVFVSILKSHPNAKFVIAGDGPQKELLEQKTSDLHISTSVIFTGRLSKEELGKRVKAADVFVLNTAYEGLSHQLLEVMDIGVPIVTTEVGGNPELIQKDVSGFLVPCNDVSELVESIERLLASEDLRSRFATHAKVRTKNFNKDEVVEQFVNMLDIDIWKKN